MWAQTWAKGTGALWIKDCVPTCYRGKWHYGGKTTFEFYGLARHNGRSY